MVLHKAQGFYMKRKELMFTIFIISQVKLELLYSRNHYKVNSSIRGPSSNSPTTKFLLPLRFSPKIISSKCLCHHPNSQAKQIRRFHNLACASMHEGMCVCFLSHFT